VIAASGLIEKMGRERLKPRKRLNVDGQALDQFGGDVIEWAPAAGQEHDNVKVLLRLPGKLQGQGGFAGAGLAVEE